MEGSVKNMTFRKKNTVYTIDELKKFWKVQTGSKEISVTYKVTKDVCASYEEICRYIENNDLFI